MRRQHLLLPSIIIAPILLILASLQFGTYAVEIVKARNITSIARFFSAIGNGAILGPILVIILIAGILLKNKRLRDTGKDAIIAFLLGSGILHILKATFERPRMAYIDTATLDLLKNPAIFDIAGRYDSFPSGHTTVAFIVAYIISSAYSPVKYILYPLAAAIALSRVYLGSHFPSDIVGGAILGVGVGYIYKHRDVVLKEHWRELLLLFLIIVLCFFKLGNLLLFDVDEAVFSEATREMMEIGNYITPIYNYLPRYDKPIFFYWLMAIAFKLFGISEFSARFWSAGLGGGLIIITYLFVKKLWDKEAAFWASICLLLNIQFFAYSHSAVTDMTLAFFITGALYSYYLGKKSEEIRAYHSSRRWYALFWISSALAVLTKGIIGIFFPAMIPFIYLLISKDLRLRHIRSILSPKLLLLFFIVAAPWFIIEFYINGWEFFNAFIIKHHLKRYTDVISSHGGPSYFYIAIIIVGFFPWVVFLPTAIYRSIKNSKQHLFFIVWFLFILIFFSISKTKLPNYILPLFPAMAIMTGVHISKSFSKKQMKYDFAFLAGFSFIFSIALFILPHLEIKMPIHYPNYFFYILGGLFLSSAILASISVRNPKRVLLVGIALNTALFMIFARTYGVPPVNAYLQKDLYVYARYSKKVLDSEGILATYEINQPSILFYAERKIERIESGNIENLKEIVLEKDTLIITNSDRTDELLEIPGLITLDMGKRYALLSNGENLAFAEEIRE